MLWTVIAVSAGVTLAATPLAGRLAASWGFVDHPAGHKFHDRATPLLGGLALYLGTVPPMLAADAGNAGAGRWAFAAAATLLFVTGLWDDRRRLSVGTKLAAQVLAAAVLVGSGVRAELPGPWWLATAFSLLWIVGITNAVNLLDSMDGAAPGVAAVATAGFLLLGGASPLAAVLAPALIGALIGFLPYNLPPARIFMGDAGSLTVGFSLAALGLEATHGTAEAGVAWMVPVLLLAVPVFDTTLVTWSRIRRGKNPMTHPGKDHFAHRLARRVGVRGALACLYTLGVVSAVLAFVVSRSGPAAAWVLAVAAALGAGIGLGWLERPERKPDGLTPPAGGSPDAAARLRRAPDRRPPGRREPRPCADPRASGIRAR